MDELFLTERRLGIFLQGIYPSDEIIHDRIVSESGLKKRPDFRIEQRRLIVEFDGEKHYRETKKIVGEREKDHVYGEMGYDVVRIPYFVQLSRDVIRALFTEDLEYEQVYPHGFISEKAVLPADFCEMGIRKFEHDLERFGYIRTQIIDSLREKTARLGDRELVLPGSLDYLLSEP